jgi:hypothetical protein
MTVNTYGEKARFDRFRRGGDDLHGSLGTDRRDAVTELDVSPTDADIRLRLDGLASLFPDLNQSTIQRLGAA